MRAFTISQSIWTPTYDEKFHEILILIIIIIYFKKHSTIYSSNCCCFVILFLYNGIFFLKFLLY